jgi:hypothetical protein
MGMNIIAEAEQIKIKARNHGGYPTLSAKSGVPYQWLCKFVYGKINNPGINNVSKLGVFFSDANNSAPTFTETKHGK